VGADAGQAARRRGQDQHQAHLHTVDIMRCSQQKVVNYKSSPPAVH